MAERSSTRPGVYLHVEFGVSWTPKTAPKGHHLSYRSKGFPNPKRPQSEWITAPDPFYQDLPSAHIHQHAVQRGHFPSHYYYSGRPQPFDPATASHLVPLQRGQQQGYQPALQQSDNRLYGSLRDGHQSHHVRWQGDSTTVHPPQHTQTAPCLRESRSLSRDRRERGSSAPAPLSENSWDADPEPIGSSALPRRSQYMTADTQKALPATPDQFRLGENSLPWSSHSFGSGFEEDGHTADKEQKENLAHSLRFSDRDRGRHTEMQSLATALMTVDNGFEDQWWYQGSRIYNVAGDLVPPGGDHLGVDAVELIESPVLPSSGPASLSVSPPSATNFDCWAKDAIYEGENTESRAGGSRSSQVNIVSPVSGIGQIFL